MSMFHELMMKKKGMPSRYQEVEWIKGDGVGAYIDTGLTVNQNTTIKITASNDTSGTNSMFGCTSDGNIYGIGQQSSGNYLFANYYTQTNINRIISSVVGNDNVFHLLELRKNEFYIDNIYIGNNTAKTFTSTDTMKIFTFSFAGSKAQSKVRNAQIYNNNTLLRNFIPVYDTETQKYGMWESVQGKFYGNDGTGDFKGSIVGYTIVGSPTITDGVASGFDSSNYLQIYFSGFKEYKLKTKIRLSSLPTSSAYRNIIGTQYLYSRWGAKVNNTTIASDIRYLYNGNWTSTWCAITYNFQIDTDYYVEVVLKNNKQKLRISTDNINWIESNVATIPEGSTFAYPTSGTNQAGALRFGGGTQYTTFDGSIYLNETYIKLDNKLWFNGQQA